MFNRGTSGVASALSLVQSRPGLVHHLVPAHQDQTWDRESH